MITSFFLHILGYDLWFYASHILLHTSLLWKYHSIHHEIIYPRYTDTYTGHPLEGPFQSVGFLLPLALQQPLDPWAFLLALLFVNARGMARHDDRTIWLIGNHHLLHHQYFKYNYGERWLDALFGTAYPQTQKVKRGFFSFLV